jgi:leader peptidase (prepilin peptidase)/N-methyltransferase
VTPYPLFAVYSALIGLCIGSFCNVCIARWPFGRSVIPRSACPTCGSTVRAIDNIPVLSWLWLRGRCRSCEARIPAAYPLVEACGGAIGLLCFFRFVPSVDALDLPHLAAWSASLVFLGALLVAAMVDVRHRIIPDETSIYAAPVMIGLVAALNLVGYDGWPATTIASSVLGAAFWGGFLAVFSIGSEYLLGREGLGWGDTKLMAMIGAFLGVAPGGFVTMFTASVLGAAAHLAYLAATRRRAELPYGPWLALAAGAYLLYGDVVLRALLPGIAALTMPE